MRTHETAKRVGDEFAENLKNLAQRAYTSADQNMLDNLVVERFREGHGNEELKQGTNVAHNIMGGLQIIAMFHL